jgi:hypothetical protein
MTALPRISDINLPHVDLFRWAKKHKVIVPLSCANISEDKVLFLKQIALRQYFVKLSSAEESACFTEAMKEAMTYLPKIGLSDNTVHVFQIAGTIFFAVLYYVSAKL